MSAPVEQLFIKQTLREALLIPIHHWQFISYLIAGPIILMTASRIPALWVNPHESTAKVIDLLANCVAGVVLTTLAVSCHRFILLGDKSVSPSRIWTWSMRETRFVLYGLVIGLIYIFVAFLPAVLAGVIGSLFEPASGWFGIVLTGLLMIAVLAPAGYVCGPLSLILPATAIDRRPTSGWMDWARAQSKDNEWPLAVLVVIIPVPVWMLLARIYDGSLQYAREAPALVAIALVTLSYALISIATIIEVGILSIAFKRLSTAAVPGQEPSEKVT